MTLAPAAPAGSRGGLLSPVRPAPSGADAVPPAHPPRWVLPGLVVAQACGISPWLGSSAVLPALTRDWALTPGDAGLLVSAVQAGFIVGTLLFALINLSDLYPAPRVYLAGALATALTTAAFALAGGLLPALVFRFLSGVALAAVYPVGMKVAVSWYPGRVGYALGWMLAAGTLGSASSYLLAALGVALPWQAVVGATGLLAAGAGLLMLRVGEGPHAAPTAPLDVAMAFRLFRVPRYRASALGYFGHMWEFYAAWGLAPAFVALALAPQGWAVAPWVNLGAFVLVAAGVAGCLGGGALSLRHGSLRVAAGALAASGACCLLAPLLFALHPLLYGAVLLAWGVTIIADSAQFFALSSEACPPRYVGTALTLQNCLGFAVTVVSIELTSRLLPALGPWVLWLLAPGPLLGLWVLLRGYRDPPPTAPPTTPLHAAG